MDSIIRLTFFPPDLGDAQKEVWMRSDFYLYLIGGFLPDILLYCCYTVDSFLLLLLYNNTSSGNPIKCHEKKCFLSLQRLIREFRNGF